MSKQFDEVVVPDWLKENYDLLVDNLHHYGILKEYAIYHDCGKHLVEYFDAENNPHYPNHEEASYEYWLSHFPNKVETAWLILNDMFFHRCTAEELENCKYNIKDLCSLLIMAVAEVNANAKMFGGYDSVSFKIKFKKLTQRGKQLCLRLQQVNSCGMKS